MNIIKQHKIQELIEEGFQLDIGAYFSEGFELVKQELGLFAGFSLLYFLIFSAAAFIPLASILVGPPLIAGIYYACHKVHFKEVLKFEDFFRGFDLFAPLVVQGLITGLLMAAVFVPAFIIFLVSVISLGNIAATSVAGLLLIVSGLLTIVGVTYITVSYVFAPLFILFADMEAWESMEASRKIIGQNFFSILWMILLLSLVNLLGALFCFIGLIFTLPITYAVIYIAFKDVLELDVPQQGNSEGDIYNHLVS